MAQVSFGQAERINDGWKFFPADVENAQAPSHNEERWRNVDLPHDWSVREQLSPTLASATGYLPGGIGWYRKTLNVPQDRQGRKLYLYFEGVYNRSEVFVNGHSLGVRPNGYISFMYDATPHIIYGGDNVVAVRTDHSRSADSRWYTGSGIYRDVWAVYAHPVHIAQWGVYARPKAVTANRATLGVDVEVENGTAEEARLTVSHELVSPDGKIVAVSRKGLTVAAGASGKASVDLGVSKPRLWSVDRPDLYRLKTTLSLGGKIIDQTVTVTGLRTLTFDPDRGFALNGEWMKVKGVCVHHDAGVLGSAVPREVWKRRLLTLKEIGCNAIRTSHNPQAPDLYSLCDELGLLVMNEAYDEWEFPKRKWLEGWNVGLPGFEGSYDFFEEWGERDLADMVRRDRNHISIFAWSIGNEVDYPNDPYSHPVLGGEKAGGFTQATYGGYNPEAPDAMRLGAIAKRLAAVVKRYDTSRPVTAGLAGVAMSNETEYPEALDIAGYNYTENRYRSDHERYPGRVIFGSENRHDLAAWNAVTTNDHIFGQFLWTGIDYLGESGRWPSRGFYSGLLDFGGFIKPRGYFRQSLWSATPMARLGVYPNFNAGWAPSMDAWPVWNYEDGQPVRVVCYTNAARARLELNGKTVGETQDYNPDTGIIYWDIPYEAGTLEVIGLSRDNREVARHAIRTSGRPYALTVKQMETKISSNRGLAQVLVQVVDEDGTPVFLSDNEITCHIDGPARLLGMEASNNEDMTDYTDHRHRAFHGQLLIYLQATGQPGQVKLRLTSPWLRPVDATIETVDD
jgi:beta-galactosidase/beta-glucuronidase